jgi:hypothetical protein
MARSARPLLSEEYKGVLVKRVTGGSLFFWMAFCSAIIAGSLSQCTSTVSWRIKVMKRQTISHMKSSDLSALLGVLIAAG